MVKAHGKREADLMRSRLVAEKSKRRYNDTKRILPGAIFYYEGKRYVLSGQLTKGAYYRAEGQGNKNFPSKDCIIYRNSGLVAV